MVDYLIEKVFEEFQKNLDTLLESHDEMIKDLEKEITLLKLAQLNTNWKIILIAVLSGAGGGAMTKVIQVFLK